MKLEDVGDQIRLQEWHMQHRGSLMARLLHHTIDHSRETDSMEEEKSQEEGERQGERQDEGALETDINNSLIVVDV